MRVLSVVAVLLCTREAGKRISATKSISVIVFAIFRTALSDGE